MKIILPLLVLLFPVLLIAQDEQLDKLVTVDGKSYDAVTIRKVEPDGLSILHAAGTAKVPFEKLSADLQTKYGYNKEAAAEHRKQLAEAQRLQDKAEQKASAKRKQVAADQASAEVDKDFADKVRKAAKMVKIEAFQNARFGLIGDVREGTLTSKAVKSSLGSKVGEKATWAYKTPAKDGVISKTKGAEAGTTRDETGAANGIPATETDAIFWEGKAWRIGMIEYTNRLGAKVAVPHYTASEKDAAAFYKRNGFSPQSDGIAQRAK